MKNSGVIIIHEPNIIVHIAAIRPGIEDAGNGISSFGWYTGFGLNEDIREIMPGIKINIPITITIQESRLM